MDPLTERPARCCAGAVHDLLRMTGHRDIVLPPAIGAIAPGTRLGGPSGRCPAISTTKSREETLLSWCTLLATTAGGHGVACQPSTHEIALGGGHSARTLAALGVPGCVVDGGSRDTFLVLGGFPVFCSLSTPLDVVARRIPGRHGKF